MASRKQASKSDENPSGWRHQPGIFHRELGFELALFNPSERRVYMLNAVAAVIWRHITPDRSAKNIAEVLSMNYFPTEAANIDELAADVRYMFRILAAEKLITDRSTELAPASPPSSVRIGIPDQEIGHLTTAYVRPSMKSFTLQELEERFRMTDKAATRFSDTWEPTPKTDLEPREPGGASRPPVKPTRSPRG